MPQVKDVLAALDARFPFGRAESWDKVGLLIGDEAQVVSRVLAAYEVTDATLDEARDADAQTIVAYHPLIFRPLENLRFSNPTARLAARMVREERALICVHTALDGAPLPHALGDALARQIGMENVRVQKPSGGGELVKIVVFVPDEALERVCDALWSAGAGQIGRYDEASFRSRGVGTFRPLEGASPYSGEIGRRAEADEWRLEVVAPTENWRSIVAAMKAAHPYEEVAFEVFSMQNTDSDGGYGPLRVGEIEEQRFDAFVSETAKRLNAPSVRVVRPKGFDMVQKVACSPGSGASFVSALERGTTFVCGDIKHHDAHVALGRGVALVDVSHAATERTTVPLLAEALCGVAGLEVVSSVVDTNPFSAWPVSTSH